MLRLKAHFDGFVQQKLNGWISCLKFTLLFQRKSFSSFYALFQTINYERTNNELINQLNRTKFSFPAYWWLVWVWTFMAKRWCLQIFNRSSTEEHQKRFWLLPAFLVLRANLFFLSGCVQRHWWEIKIVQNFVFTKSFLILGTS